MYKLVEMSAGLFIDAAMVCKFIQPVQKSQKPHALLQKILAKDESFISSQFKCLNQMYTQILEHAITGDLMPDVHRHFRSTVVTIAHAYSQLTTVELAELLTMTDLR